ncbi:uncharacterized protein F4807DRAFT_336909 [Annulohypoxylon truncatum]|uniref:uncharacterized protein n=1 Tax=Annulohypoxylon truncatum TaxID=327061 RepID=UPI00200870FA|nr:uncharacterized protein F4807DRAFT_336909 [Annulohypoxylon truncatum]KAI1204404.1 hypothetical protein F4807DRAFT_336909 [Annulohypoxylon truncatum]
MMAGNQRDANINGPHGAHRPHAPIIPTGPGSRPVGPQLPPVQPSPGTTRAGITADVARGPSVEISDVSRDLKTMDDMREDLTEYAIFRFEKMSTRNQYDDEGRPQRPTWDRAIRTRVPGMSPREIVREIQHLNRHTRNLTDKLKSLSPVLQRQIDKAQEDLALQNSDPINYHWVLIQLDHQLREIAPSIAFAGGSHSTSRRRYGSTRRRPYGRGSRHESKSFERVSLRAYFKRTPRPNVDISMLWEAKNLRNSQVVRPHSYPQQQQHSHQNPHQQPHIHQQPQLQPNPGLDLRAQRPSAVDSGGSTPFRPDRARGPPPIAPYPNKPGAVKGINPVNNVAVGDRDIGGGRGNDPARNHDNHSDIESDSDYSNYLSMDGSVDSQMTPDTSQPGSPINGISHARGRGEDRMPPRHKSRIRDGNIHDRRSLGSQEYHNVKARSRVQSAVTPGPPRPPPPSMVDIDKVRDEAYLAGMRHGRDKARVSQERAYRESKRSRPRPHIISATRPLTPPYGRRMSSSDLEGYRHQRDLDDEISRFNRLSLDEEDDYEPVLRHADARQRKEFEHLMHQGSVLEGDPFDRERSSYSRHGSRRYQNPYMTDGSESDLSLPERGKMWFRY